MLRIALMLAVALTIGVACAPQASALQQCRDTVDSEIQLVFETLYCIENGCVSLGHVCRDNCLDRVKEALP